MAMCACYLTLYLFIMYGAYGWPLQARRCAGSLVTSLSELPVHQVGRTACSHTRHIPLVITGLP